MTQKIVVECEHWQECDRDDGGCCKINKYNNPSFGLCLLACKSNTNKPTEKKARKMLRLPAVPTESRGLGDTVKKLIDKFTGGKVKPCGGCKKRQEALNKMMPYGKDKTP